jgi:NUMOD4 motif/NUMOD1 domain
MERYPYQNRELKNIKGEKWKDIPELEEYFQISNFGRVKRLEYVLPFKDGRVYTKETMIMKPTLVRNPNHFVGDETHFLRITLNLHGNTYSFSIGRMVHFVFSGAFNFADTELLVVAKDGNGKNIRPANLTLISRSERQSIVQQRKRHENILLRPEVRLKAIQAFKALVCTPVSQYDSKGNKLKTFPGIPDAAKAIGKTPSTVANAAKGYKVTAGGYLWRFGHAAKIDVHAFLENRKLEINKRRVANAKKHAGEKNNYGKIISQYNMQGSRVAIYMSLMEAERKTGIRGTTIGKVALGKAKSAGGYYWAEGRGKPTIDLGGYKFGIGSNGAALRKSVRQYNLQGKLVQLFASVTLAAQSVNVSPGNIVAALKGYQKTAGGYHWKYAKAL